MLTIHVGLHKTGTSSIQLALASCGRQHGREVFVPESGQDRSEEGWEARVRRVADARSGVLSDENLLGSPVDGYSLAMSRIRMIHRATAGKDVRIVMYVRPQVDWLSSLYLQLVQEGCQDAPEHLWNGWRDSPFLRWSQLREALVRESGATSVVVRAYAPGRDAVKDFFGVAGLAGAGASVARGIRENSSISAAQAPILARLNRSDGATDERRRHFRAVFQQKLAGGAARGLSPMDESLQYQIHSAFEADWSRLAAAVAVDDPVEGRVIADLWKPWPDALRPYAGGDLTAPAVQDELVRSVEVLSSLVDLGGARGLAGLMRRARHGALRIPVAQWSRSRRSQGLGPGSSA